MNELTKSIFDTILLLTENRMANLEYDKTIVCTIVDDSNAKNDKYTVTDGSVKFEAIGNGEKYKIKDSVRILIPGGDYSKKKYIQGKAATDDNDQGKPVTYVSPLDSVITITNNLITETGPWGIAATGNGSRVEQIIDRIEIADPDIQNNKMLNTMCVSAEFFSHFEPYDIRSGDYGLHIVLGTIKGDGTPARHDLFLSAENNMFGNVYSFKIYTKQEMAYSLSQWDEELVGISISLYQDGNFTYFDEKEQSNKPLELNIDGIAINNIKVQNVQLSFGNEISTMPDNSIELYTNDSLVFDHMADADKMKENEKKLRLLWYNKTEDNQYLGFSDGIFDLQYDEREYLAEIADNTRLLNEISPVIPDDENCLDLSASGKEISQWGSATANLIGKNLYQTLKGFKDYTAALYSGGTHILDTLLNNGGDNSLSKYSYELEAASQLLPKYYAKILQSAKKGESTNFDDLAEAEDNQSLNYDGIDGNIIEKRHKKIINILNDVMSKIDDVFTSIYNDKIAKGYNSFYDIYYSYDKKYKIIRAQLQDYVDKIKKLVYNEDIENLADSLAERLMELSNKDTIDIGISYADRTLNKAFQELWNNKYCIYWYQYEQDAPATQFLPAGWKIVEEFNNHGLPSAIADGSSYYPKKASITDLNGYVELQLNREIKEEKYKIILFYNHEQYSSNTLVFTNSSDVIDKTTIDKAGALSIEHVENSKSQDSYQLHGANGFLLNAADAQVKRKLRARFTSEKEGFNEVDELHGATIYWYIPKRSTMLEAWTSDFKETMDGKDVWYTDRLDTYKTVDALEKAVSAGLATKSRFYFVSAHKNADKQDIPEGVYKYDEGTSSWTRTEFSSSAVVNAANYKEGYDCFYRVINTKIYDENDVGERERALQEQTIFPYHIGEYYFSTATQNGIFCKVVKNDIDFYAEQYFSFASFGNSGTNYTLALTPNPEYPMFVAQGLADGSSSVGLQVDIALYDSDNNKLNIPYDNNVLKLVGPNNDDYIIIPQQDQDGYLIGCIVTKKSEEKSLSIYGAILQCNINNVEIAELNNKKINLSSQLAIPYSNILNQYMIGPGIITYNSDGAEPKYYKNKYALYNSVNETEIVANWHIRYYYYNTDTSIWDYYILTQDGSENWIITLSDGETKPNLTTETKNKYSLNYVPKLLADDSLMPSSVYMNYNSNSSAQIYPIVMAMKDSQVLWAQPLIINQDQYFSSALNEWDGSLKIDEDNSTILSAMVGAGRKNDKNQFEGILMGDVQSNADGAVSQVGLYGYHEGQQSFGFKSDGTGFIGKQGRGRINFNGNTSIIESAAFSDELLKTGMSLDLDDGILIVKNNDVNIFYVDSKAKYPLDKNKPYLELKDSGGNPLLHISDNAYYLQTSNYVPGGTVGVHLDLKNGELLANKFKIKAGNTLLLNSHPDNDGNYFWVGNTSGSFVKFTQSGAFSVGYNNESLLEVSSDEYILKSYHYKQATEIMAPDTDDANKGSGMKIDLETGSIDAYNFKINSKNIYMSSAENETTYLQIKDDSGNILLNIGSGQPTAATYNLRNRASTNPELYIQSAGYDRGAGVKIDLFNNTINAYNFTLNTTDEAIYLSNSGKEQTIEEHGSISSIVFSLGNNFGVTNEGIVYANGVNIKGHIHADTGTFNGTITAGNGNIGGWDIGSNHLITKDYSLGADNSFHMYSECVTQSHNTFGIEANWMLTVGSSFAVTNDGKIYAKEAYLTNATIDKNSYLGQWHFDQSGYLGAWHNGTYGISLVAGNNVFTPAINIYGTTSPDGGSVSRVSIGYRNYEGYVQLGNFRMYDDRFTFVNNSGDIEKELYYSNLASVRQIHQVANALYGTQYDDITNTFDKDTCITGRIQALENKHSES